MGMKTQELPPGSALNGRPLTLDELTGLPLLSVVLNTEGNAHAWQKRLVFTEGGARSEQWFCTTDSDWGETTERLHEWGDIVLLWLPPEVHVCGAPTPAEIALPASLPERKS